MPLTVNSTCGTCGYGIVNNAGALYQPAVACPGCTDVYFHRACQGATACSTCGSQFIDAATEATVLAQTITQTPAPAQQPAAVVPTTTDLVDTRNDLGGFDRRFVWNCPATANGYIVQQIVRVERVLDNGDAEIAGLTHRDTYWEAWPVRGGVVMFPDGTTPMTGASHDAWCRDENRDERAGKHGDWSITGNVYWCDVSAAGVLSHFAANSVDSASGLLATRTAPAIGGGAVLTHSRQGNWDGRTRAVALALLNADSDNGVMTATSREKAITELTENGFSNDVAANAVDDYIAGGGEFTVEESDSDSENS